MKNRATVFTETAWNFYRAFRTYPEPKKAMADARAFIPERGRVYRLTMENDGGQHPDDTNERTVHPTIEGPPGIAHARAIALLYNLDQPTTDAAFNRGGIKVLTECIAHEIETGTEATLMQCREWYEDKHIRYNDERTTPFIIGLHDFSFEEYLPALYPYITLNLSVYEGRDDFVEHTRRLLPDLYDHLQRLKNLAVCNYAKASMYAEDEWQRQKMITLKKINRIVREHGQDALFGHLQGDEWKKWEKEKREYLERMEVFDEQWRAYQETGKIGLLPPVSEQDIITPSAPRLPKADPPAGLTKKNGDSTGPTVRWIWMEDAGRLYRKSVLDRSPHRHVSCGDGFFLRTGNALWPTFTAIPGGGAPNVWRARATGALREMPGSPHRRS